MPDDIRNEARKYLSVLPSIFSIFMNAIATTEKYVIGNCHTWPAYILIRSFRMLS